MQEPVFLLIVMAMTALGVRVFLGQLHGTPLRLPRPRLRIGLRPSFRLKLPALPGLPGKRAPKRSSKRRRRYDDYDDYDDDGAYQPTAGALGRSPFMVPAAAPGAGGLHTIPREEPDAYEGDYDEDAYLPPNQVDFFAADDNMQSRPAVRRIAAAPDEPGETPAVHTAVHSAEPEAATSGGVVNAGPPGPREVPEEPEIDPNDIMSFFEKPIAATQLPETLREEIQHVSASELLAEARQLRALLGRDAA